MGECLPDLGAILKKLFVGESAKEFGEARDDERLKQLGYNKVDINEYIRVAGTGLQSRSPRHKADSLMDSLSLILHQSLYRGFQTATNLAVIISAQSVLLSVYSSFGTGLAYGGPVVCLWGWVLASIGSICVALGMSELASAYPTSVSAQSP